MGPSNPINKRTFLKQLLLTGVLAFPSLKVLSKESEKWTHLTPEEVAGLEDFWSTIRKAYRLKPDYINLEGGYYCMMPEEVLEAYLEKVRDVNYHASWYMRTEQFDNKKTIANRLAEIADCGADELVITRNTTESLDLVIGGYPWEAGDEAIMAEQDYGAMLNMFDQVAKRHGVVNKRISIPNHPDSDEEIVDLYEAAITSRTRLIMVCHMINITGHILPVRKICDMAHRYGVEVMVDGAHSFAHIPVSMQELGCDYFGSSLHKWLSAPLGSGILYIKKDKIPKLWPLFAESPMDSDNILRLNHTGTTPVHVDLGIASAIAFYEFIGAERKEARLRYLQRYWTQQVRDIPGIQVNTSADPERACAIANVGVEGLPPKEMAELLLKDYGIWTVAIDRPGVVGCRITPNVFTTLEELDVFVGALKELAL